MRKGCWHDVGEHGCAEVLAQGWHVTCRRFACWNLPPILCLHQLCAGDLQTITCLMKCRTWTVRWLNHLPHAVSVLHAPMRTHQQIADTAAPTDPACS